MKAVKQIKIDTNELTIGMYVSGLDRPWTQTPFPLQGFYIRDREEIKQLKVHCNYVYIDVLKGSAPVKTDLRKLSNMGVKSKKNLRAESSATAVSASPIRVRDDVYTEITPIGREIGEAKALHQQVYRAVGTVLSQVNVDNQQVPIKETKRAASAMVDSIVRNPDAFTWLAKVREKDEHTYSHAVRSAVWALLFGRHIGLPKPELDVLAMGVLLKDIGKTRLPRKLIEATERTAEEQREYEQFVVYGLDILKKLPEVKPRVISVVKTHCERVNGSGFPSHLRGDKVPLLGKIAGIVTFYDETTNPRNKNPLSPSKAVSMLYEARGTGFQDDLVVEFIRAIGLYPTGTLVELNTGEVGVVVEQNFERRLKPRVMVVLDATKQELSTPRLIDLSEDEKQKRAMIDSGKYVAGEIEYVEISQDLKPGTYNIDITNIRDEYIESTQAKGLLARLKEKLF
ncbi:HD-GYP domain-containing protein [Agaribacterium sp. ZY112]|uniref:HD-GYP domain-containing protein n=1 Tax=Agaribacterium sp. ZY112 TaxID=3233574 RepID=UPI0035266923